MKFGWTLFVGTAVLLSGTEIRAEELPVYTLDAVTVTATRTEQVPEMVPPAVQTIDREEIAGSGAGNIRDVLAAETNMILTSSRFGGHNLILRGMDTDKSLILINGRRVANEASAAGLGNAMALDRINLFNVDRIEIASGPASALYGSDAMGGVINIITLTPEKPEVTVGLEAGSETTANWWHADTGRIGKFSASFDARFDKYRRDLLPDDDLGHGNDTSQNYNAALQYELDEDSRIRAWSDYFSEHMKSGSSDAFTSRDYRQKNYGLSWEGSRSQNSWQVSAYASQFSWGSRDQTETGTSSFNKDRNRLWRMEVRDTLKAGDHHQISAGLEYEKDHIRGTGLGTGGDHPYIEWDGMEGRPASEKKMDIWSAYVQDEITWGKWFAAPAVRYDRHSVYGGHYSPRIGLTYRAGPRFRLKANYGDGFKAPEVMQLYYDMYMMMGPAGMVHLIGNPELRPEESVSWDLGLETEFGRGYAALTYFDNDVKNLIDARFEGWDGDTRQYRYVNVGQARIRGLETTLGWHLGDRVEAKLISTWMDAEDAVIHTRLPQRPSFSQVWQLSYDDHRDNGWSAMLWDQLYLDYVTEGFVPGSAAESTSYNVLNVTVARKLGRNSRIYGSIRNLLDRQDERCDLEGRFWSVGVSHSF